MLRGKFLIHRFLMKNYASEEESLPLPNGQASELRRASKLQQLSTRFENIKMSEDDKFADFYARLSVIVNGCCNLGNPMPEDRIVKKIFRSLLMMYYSKKIAIEESKNLNTYKLAELIGSITTYEMGGNPARA